MNECIIRAPSYKEKLLVYNATEIYLPDEHNLSEYQKFKVFKKFSVAYEKLRSK